MSEKKELKLGSLFDGSGGFPLSAKMCGITPVWASEVEPYPIAVTTSRFPDMKHLGDVSKINGADIEPVDIITFGSPCQDMSVAGKREGIKHESNGDETTTRSGLFIEAIRIIKEMRAATDGKYPRYAVWENVLGAFSSNKGEDFRLVIEEFVKVNESEAVGPEIPKGGWPHADCYVGDGWSIAYRTVDAQYWGVPQRRRRIYLVADFAGERAGEILFKQEGLRGNFEESRTQRERTATYVEDCARISDCKNEHLVGSFLAQKKAESVAWCTGEISPCLHNGACPGFQNAIVMEQDDLSDVVDKNILDDQGGQQITVRKDGLCPTLRAETHGNLPCVLSASGFKAGQSMAGGIGWQDECAATLSAQASGTEPSVCIECYDARGNGDGKLVSTITGDHENRITDYTSVICLQGNGIDRSDTAGCNGKGWKEDTPYTLNTIDRPAVAYSIGNGQANQSFSEEVTGTLNCMHDQQCVVVGMDCRNGAVNGDLCGTLQAKPNGGFSYNCIHPVIIKDPIKYIVRRLTPTECARLQGFPDNWGVPNAITDMTDNEYKFWEEVRNTHALISGKQTKSYTKEQIVKWRNGLHTDSSEYRMWGNGICLYNALYVMQGIVSES